MSLDNTSNNIFPSDNTKNASSMPRLIIGQQWLSPNLSLIKLDDGTQPLFVKSDNKIESFANKMLKNVWDWEAYPLTPIQLFFDSNTTTLWCADGHSRIKAARQCCKYNPISMLVNIRHGTFHDAQLYYCVTNLFHETYYRGDKSNLVSELIKIINTLPVFDKRRLWSDREIARQTNVDHKTVGNVRRKLNEEFSTKNVYLLAKVKEQQRISRNNTRRFQTLFKDVTHHDVIALLHNSTEEMRQKLLKGVIEYYEKSESSQEA